VLVCFVSFLVWFWLLTQYLASRLGVFSFMTPIFGVVFGAWLLSEPIEPNFLAGALMVLAGVLLVSGYGWLKSLRR
jgi:drug/metabolite transporter (DMT)-like permease